MLNIDRDIIEDLYSNKRLSDKKISELFDCKEDRIRWLRTKHGIKTIDRNKEKRKFLNSLSDNELKNIILNHNYTDIQNILGVSSFVWKSELRNRGIELKSKLRINSYPELTKEQLILIIGSLLGDGSIDKGSKNCSRFSESHAPNQLLYLKKKHALLKPFSRDIYIDKSHEDFFSYRFMTTFHPHFKKFRDVFYDPELNGKLIPLEFIKQNWDDKILAYWFLDDGHFDERSGCYTIANKCPIPDQLVHFLRFLSDYYNVNFSFYEEPDLFSVKIPLKFRERFIDIIQKTATEDMLYKLPSKCRGVNKGIIYQEKFKGSSRINDIRNKIFLGYTLKDLQKEYPITNALFLKLGGTITEYIDVNHPILKKIVGDGKIPLYSDLDKDTILGTLLGDGNIFKYGKNTCIFSFAHSAAQYSYVKLKYELLKYYVKRVRYLKNSTNDFYSFHVFLKNQPVFYDYYNLFYTAEKESKRYPQKYLFKRDIIELINLRSFAFWIMDDGKKYGTGRYRFSITAAKQPYYNFEDFYQFVGNLSEHLGIKLRAREEKISYEITPYPEEAEGIFNKIKMYIWPYFSYKFAAASEDCGEIYRELPWFSDWEKEHAYMYDL